MKNSQTKNSCQEYQTKETNYFNIAVDPFDFEIDQFVRMLVLQTFTVNWGSRRWIGGSSGIDETSFLQKSGTITTFKGQKLLG